MFISIKQKLAIIDIRDDNNLVDKLKVEFPGVSILFMVSSVTNRKDLHHAYTMIVKNFGNIHIIVNAAGILNEHNPQQTLDINVVR